MSAATHWIRPALARGEAVVGIMVSELKTPMLGAMLDATGLDFAIIDQEHGAYGPDALAAVVAGFRGGRCRPIVRVAEARREYILTALELGAAGILVPHVETAAEVAEIVRYARYAPDGDRGLSLMRAHTGFRRVDKDRYLAAANAEVLVAIQIETAPAIERLDDILAVAGLDLAFIGPSDLSLSCGVPGSLRAPEMRALVDRIVERARAHGVAVGIQTYDLEVAAELIAGGVGLVSCNTDANALLSSLSGSVTALRRLAGGRLAAPDTVADKAG
jgi:2-keto-3-deoxy-L-rhamnonate aldolase RhmA